MRTILHWVSGLAVIFFSYACKKNADHPMVQPPVVTDINLETETSPPIIKPTSLQINANIGGFYSGLPANYAKTTKSYPLLLSIHGGGQYGNGQLDLPILLNDGLPQLLDEKIFPANILSNGINYSFIIMAPQLKQFPNAQEIEDVIDYARKNYRVDSTRIYIFGLSNGAAASCLTAASFADHIAAIVPAAGEFNYNPVCTSLAKNKVAIWAFHNDNDPVDNILAVNNFISTVNSFSPVIVPRLTVFRADNHDAWTRAINPSYKENNMNIYEWMLQFKK
jgi:poly(3-hydroxybutyrate) depolymerase